MPRTIEQAVGPPAKGKPMIRPRMNKEIIGAMRDIDRINRGIKVCNYFLVIWVVAGFWVALVTICNTIT